MTKDKAAKYNGKWVQVKADYMDAVSEIWSAAIRPLVASFVQSGVLFRYLTLSDTDFWPK